MAAAYGKHRATSGGTEGAGMAEGRPTGVDGSDALDAPVADRVVPVIVLEDASAAAPLADAPVAGGLHCAEVTFRTDAAEAALRAMATDDRLVVGAGTVVSAEQVERAHAAGARFIVSPGLDRKSTRLNSSHVKMSYAVFCSKKKEGQI